MLHNIRGRLNALQLSHIDGNGKCGGRICALPGCTVCLCGKRKDANTCCDLHRAELNNQISGKRNKQARDNLRINAANILKIKDAWERGFRNFKVDFLLHIDFDFSVKPISVMEKGKELAAFDDIVMWTDAEGNYHLEKL